MKSSESRLETQQFLKSTNFGKAFEKTRTEPVSAEKASESQTPSSVGDREAEKTSCESAAGQHKIDISQGFSLAEKGRLQVGAFG